MMRVSALYMVAVLGIGHCIGESSSSSLTAEGQGVDTNRGTGAGRDRGDYFHIFRKTHASSRLPSFQFKQSSAMQPT